jgi:eukaryotic-like serine/threonine-protein kinase
MERMDGSLLTALRDKSTPFNYLQKIDCCKQIALGLEHLHSHNIIHRDLAARNILVSFKKKPNFE